MFTATRVNVSNIVFVLIAILRFTASRDITFPPVVRFNPYQTSFSDSLDDVDIVSGRQFSGLTTFANLPYVSCFDENADVQKYDVAFLGAPFDTGVSARPGARFGPVGIRLGSHVGRAFAESVAGENSFEDWAAIIDCGDAPLTPFDNTVALKQLEKAHKAGPLSFLDDCVGATTVISGRTANTTSRSSIPRIITLGGDHTTTLAALRSTHVRWGEVSVVHFDSHIDTWDPSVLGGGISDYAAVNHGTFLHLAHEEGLIRNTSIHAGIRAPLIRPKGDLRNDLRCGFEMIHAREIDYIGVKGVMERIMARVGNSKVYISVDIDVLDPAFAPATGTSEVGGWTTRELLTILDGLKGIRIIGADVVEVAPIYDNAGETTGLAAAEVAHSLMTLMIQTPVEA